MKTTVVKGVLTSCELMLAILFRWRVQLCGHDIVWLWHSHGSSHGDHHTLTTRYCAIAYLPQLNYNHSICRWHRWHFIIIVLIIIVVVVILSLFVLIISAFGNVVYTLHLRTYCCVHCEWRAQILICFGCGSHINDSVSCGVPSDILGWRMARRAWFSCNQGIAHPWLSYGRLKMLR